MNTVPSGLHRSKDPGVGAFSTYHDRKSIAKVNIKKGQELFVNYGGPSIWFVCVVSPTCTYGDGATFLFQVNIGEVSLHPFISACMCPYRMFLAFRFEQRARLGPIPLKRGLKKATKFFRQFRRLREDHPNLPSIVYDELWDVFVKQTEWNESRIFGAFYHTDSEWYMLEKNMTLKQIRVQESMRSQEWLEERGNCADHLRADVSTIRQAGRGAFATRALPEGAVVAHLPLIQITDKTVLEMYDFKDIKNKKRSQRTPIGYQLITNYCYGHTNSTMLLCPYGPISVSCACCKPMQADVQVTNLFVRSERAWSITTKQEQTRN